MKSFTVAIIILALLITAGCTNNPPLITEKETTEIVELGKGSVNNALEFIVNTPVKISRREALRRCRNGEAGYLRCCDGWTSGCRCNKRRGCCSHHKGVCGCDCPGAD
jgi:hypothetical protein